MSKNLLRDMVPIKKREAPSRSGEHADFQAEPPSPHSAASHESSKGKSRHALWGVAVVAVMFLLFALSFLFSGAKITVFPKVKDLVLNENLSAAVDASGADLPFELVVISGEESKTIQASGQKDVSLRATGQIIIYNTFSASPQPLSIDTRLLGSNGKIYKTTVKIIVPGAKGAIPGSAEVGIYAAEPGAPYNSAPLDFKIFGFKGTPKYSKFYGRSKSDITGGFAGKAPDITDAEKTQLVGDLKTSLTDKLFNKAQSQSPGGFILWKEGAILDVPAENIKFTNSENVTSATMAGTLSGFLFDEKKITQKIVEQALPDVDPSGAYIPNIRDLSFALSNNENLTGDIQNISFNLSGSAKIVWRVDENKLIGDMLGARKSDFEQILSKYPDIESASLAIRPFWNMSFPDKTKDIQVIVNYPK